VRGARRQDDVVVHERDQRALQLVQEAQAADAEAAVALLDSLVAAVHATVERQPHREDDVVTLDDGALGGVDDRDLERHTLLEHQPDQDHRQRRLALGQDADLDGLVVCQHGLVRRGLGTDTRLIGRGRGVWVVVHASL
jgi:hypothetical protein